MWTAPLLLLFFFVPSRANEITRCCSIGVRHFRESEHCVNPTGSSSILCNRASSVCCLRALLDQSCNAGRKLAQNNVVCPSLIDRIGGGVEKECCECCMMARDLRSQGKPCVASRKLSASCLQSFNACCNRTRGSFGATQLVDRCAQARCSHLCNDRGGKKVECSCRKGYTLSPDGFTCIPVEECNFLNERAYCNKHRDRCIVKRGMYRCDPKDKNLRFMSAAPTAEFIPHEEFSNDIAHLIQRKPQRLYPTPTQCAPGFQDSEGKGVCEDVDECAMGEHRCTPLQICRNTLGSHECVAKQCSWSEIMNSRTGECIPVDCPLGYIPKDGRCEDINECAVPGRCGSMQVCVNTQGSYRCVQDTNLCRTGYKALPSSGICVDINECEEGSHTCGSVQCINLQGSFTCKCSQGFRFNTTSRQCGDINECEAFGGHMCSPHATCENTIGSFRCHCKLGFVLAADERTCHDIDECSMGSNQCHQKCVNTPGSYECDCRTGYELDNDQRTCRDIDECQGNNMCMNVCMNTPGSFECRCPEGYRIDNDGFRCKDINECNTDPCQRTEDLCVNTIGGFKCRSMTCPENFVYDSYYKNNVEDGYSCLKKCSVNDSVCMNNITKEILYQFRSIASMPVVSSPIEVSRIHTQMHMPFSVQYEIGNDPNGFFSVEQREHIGIINLVKPIKGPREETIKINIRTKSRANLLMAHNVAYINISVSQYLF